MPGYLREKSYLAVCKDYNTETGLATFIQRNKTIMGDAVEMISPGFPGRGFTISRMTDAQGNEIASAPHPFMEFAIPVPFAVHAGDIMRSADRSK